MNLRALGFDDWFREQADAVLEPGRSLARITAVDRDAFLLRDEHGETPAELAGRFRFEAVTRSDFPCVGDWVCVDRHTSGGPAIVHAVLPRRTVLRRKCPGKTVDFQMIAANIDVALIVQSCHYDFNRRRLDRYLVAAREGDIQPVIILSKTDLVAPEELDSMVGEIRDSGIHDPILPISNTTGHGLDELRSLLAPGRTFCLLGSSGVGKTTLINRLIGRDTFDTKVVSRTGEGTHATVRRQLIVLDGGAILMDTPGMRELGILGADAGLSESFTDIHELAQSCHFSDCTHSGEPGCAVASSIEAGELDPDRYQSYLKLKRESDYNQMSYVEKRKKDRAFGRFIKSVKKHGKH